MKKLILFPIVIAAAGLAVPSLLPDIEVNLPAQHLISPPGQPGTAPPLFTFNIAGLEVAARLAGDAKAWNMFYEGCVGLSGPIQEWMCSMFWTGWDNGWW